MLIFKRFSVFLLPFLVFLAFITLFFEPQWLYFLIGAVALIIVLNTWYLTGQKLDRTDFLNFLYTPILFVGSSLIFYAFLESPVIKTMMIFLVTVSIFWYFNKIFVEFYKNQVWQLSSFKPIITYLQVLTIWFMGSAFFGLIILLNFSLVLTVIILALSLVLFLNQQIWLADKRSSSGYEWLIYLIFLFIAVECVIILEMIPFSYYFKGFLITSIFYLFSQGLLINLFKDNDQPSKKNYQRLLIFASSLILTVLIFNYLIIK